MFTSRLSATAARSAGWPCLVTIIMLHDKNDKNDNNDKTINKPSSDNDNHDNKDNNDDIDNNYVKTNLSNW